MARHRMVVKDWHRCCDKATKHIHCAVDRTSWIFVPGFVVITAARDKAGKGRQYT